MQKVSVFFSLPLIVLNRVKIELKATITIEVNTNENTKLPLFKKKVCLFNLPLLFNISPITAIQTLSVDTI